jgi:hypothetical protein
MKLGGQNIYPTYLTPQSNSNSLANQLGFHLILTKQEKLAGKPTWQK